jgi:sugar-specific transcriptional regulator TrmB
MNRDINNALKSMGLTNYETKTYTTLTSIISGSATEISVASNIPRPKIYETLNSLEKKGFIEINRGKPLKFIVIPPHEVFRQYRMDLKENLDKAEAELNMIYENQIPKVPAPLWIIHGSDKLVKKELEIISRAEKSLFIMAGFMFNNEAKNLKQTLNSVVKKGVNIRIVTSPYSIVDDKKIDIAQELVGLKCPWKVLQIPFLKLVVRDNQEMLIAFSKFSGENVVPETAMGIWNQYQAFVETISGVYEIIWNTNLFNQLKENIDKN